MGEVESARQQHSVSLALVPEQAQVNKPFRFDVNFSEPYNLTAPPTLTVMAHHTGKPSVLLSKRTCSEHAYPGIPYHEEVYYTPRLATGSGEEAAISAEVYWGGLIKKTEYTKKTFRILSPPVALPVVPRGRPMPLGEGFAYLFRFDVALPNWRHVLSSFDPVTAALLVAAAPVIVDLASKEMRKRGWIS